MRNSIRLSAALLYLSASAPVLAQTAIYGNSSMPAVEINLDALDKRSADIYIPQVQQQPAPPQAAVTQLQKPAPVTKNPKATNMFDEDISPTTTKPVLPQQPAFISIPSTNFGPAVSDNPSDNTAANTSPSIAPVPEANGEKVFKPGGYVEVGGDASSLNHNYNSWTGEYIKGEIQTDPNNRWNATVLNQTEFGSTGQYGVIGNTHAFNEDWYSSINLGAATEGFFLPRYRIDAFINRKWLDDKSLVTTLGVGEYKAMDDHRDSSLFLGATYYFPKLWIVEGGVRYNYSDPGGVDSTSAFVAITEGEDKKHFITLRYGFGREAYQIIGPGDALSDFESQIVSLELRQWVSDIWGFDVRGEYYHNPNYDRTGINFGVFHEF